MSRRIVFNTPCAICGERCVGAIHFRDGGAYCEKHWRDAPRQPWERAADKLLSRRFDVVIDQQRQEGHYPFLWLLRSDYQRDALMTFEGEGGALAQLDKDWPL